MKKEMDLKTALTFIEDLRRERDKALAIADREACGEGLEKLIYEAGATDYELQNKFIYPEKQDEKPGFDSKDITLFLNNTITNDPCYLCGQRTDPDGFDYGYNLNLVCPQCVEKYKPELIKIKAAADSFTRREVDSAQRAMKNKVRSAISEPLEDRIPRALDGTEDDIPF